MTPEEVCGRTGPTSGSKITVKIAPERRSIVAAQGTFYLQAGDAGPGSPILCAVGMQRFAYDSARSFRGVRRLSNPSKVAALLRAGARIGAYA